MTDKRHITLTHLNVRQSISILLTKLVLIDLLIAVIVLIYYFAVIQGEQFIKGISANNTIFILVFTIIGFLKILASSYVILKWLHEYYEITPEHVVHKHGIIFKKSENYRLNLVRVMSVEDSFFGELLNYATITLYDIRLKKYLDMYLVHNARRYAKILKEIKPDLEIKEDHVWLPFKKVEDIGTLEKK